MNERSLRASIIDAALVYSTLRIPRQISSRKVCAASSRAEEGGEHVGGHVGVVACEARAFSLEPLTAGVDRARLNKSPGSQGRFREKAHAFTAMAIIQAMIPPRLTNLRVVTNCVEQIKSTHSRWSANETGQRVCAARIAFICRIFLAIRF